jgi:glycosyltransferase involved in cell wall biosynthesis
MLVETEDKQKPANGIVVSGIKPFVVVGIPAFNEEKTIACVVLEAQRHADEVVVCDDGSVDLTGEIAKRLGADVVRHERNLGYGSAIQSLFDRARELGADVLVTLDADGQHEPREVPNVVQPIAQGRADIVIGSRFVDGRSARAMPWYRRVGVRVITRMVNGRAKSVVKDAQSGFRAYGRRALDGLTTFEAGMGVSVEILLDAGKRGLRVCEVASSCSYRNGVETSSENSVRHGLGIVMSIMRFIVEEKPLTILGVPGIACLVAGAFFGVWMLQLYASEHQIVTNVALASIAFTFIGLFFVFTAITLYAISRVVQKTNNRH